MTEEQVLKLPPGALLRRYQYSYLVVGRTQDHIIVTCNDVGMLEQWDLDAC